MLNLYFVCSNCFDSERVLEVVDNALSSAADTGTKLSEGTDQEFDKAVKALSNYERIHHPK